jgi:hypothetical protein
VYSYSHDSGPFSDGGDSGSIVVNGKGQIVGLLTAGNGVTDSTDVTYTGSRGVSSGPSPDPTSIRS